jgi:hypothetical protein
MPETMPVTMRETMPGALPETMPGMLPGRAAFLPAGRIHARRGVLATLALVACVLTAAACGGDREAVGESEIPPLPAFEELRRFPAPDARQAVAVDASYFYVVSNRQIDKHDKRSGAKVASWTDTTGQIVHLNSGLVRDGVLYCAHSNHPDVPMASSIEMFDTQTLEHVGSHSFGIFEGSATWVDRARDRWWVAFAHYAGHGGVPGKGPAWTSLVSFDDEWRRTGGYSYPREVIARFTPDSNSGGVWGADGNLYVTGHEAPEVYVLRLPERGPTLELVGVAAAPMEGQGIAWDPLEPGVLWGIVKRDRVVVARQLPAGDPAPAGDGVPSGDRVPMGK